MIRLLALCYEFFKTGLFAVGGGLATIPFLTDMSAAHPDWFTMQQLADMIAVGESTPGPVGINMATYVGYTVAGVPGAVLATLSLVLPSFLIILIVARFLDKFSESRYVKDAFGGLRPAVTGLIAAAGFSVVQMALLVGGGIAADGLLASVNWKAAALFAAIIAATQIRGVKKLHPICFIALAAGIGIVFEF